MKKLTLYTELSYVFGILLLAYGTALLEIADFGMSMVVAPPYLMHLKLCEALPFFTFGTAGYVFQALLLAVMAVILRKFKITYLFSFATAVIYGFALDGAILSLEFVTADSVIFRLCFFVFGMLLSSAGVSMLFHTYISPEVYELFVKEVANKFRWNVSKFKTVYDCSSCLIAVVMSFCFFGFMNFRGIGWGTVVCALCNGFLIGRFSKLFERIFDFKDKFKMGKYFE